MASLSLKGAQLLVRQPQLSAAAIQHCGYSKEVRVRDPRELNTAAMKRGRGGRSSFSGDVVTVFGSNGLIGTGVTNRLGKNGSQIILPYRGDHYKMMRMKPVGDLGQILFSPFELIDEESIRRAVSHSNIVINLIGRNFETNNYSFEKVHIEGPQRIARLCKEAGVKRLVHMSHINAREKPEEAFLKGGSRFLASKYQGELAVRAEFPEATIFRASDVYAERDSFINHWMSRWRWSHSRKVALFGKGELTVKQPLWAPDMVTGIMNSLYDPEAVGQTYEAVGPERMTQAEMLGYMFDCASLCKDYRSFEGFSELMFSPNMFFKAWMLNKIGLGNKIVYGQQSIDRLERDSISDKSDGYPDMAEALGFEHQGYFKLKIPHEVIAYDFYGYYLYETPEEQHVPTPYKTLNRVEERAVTERRAQGFLPTILPKPLGQLVAL